MFKENESARAAGLTHLVRVGDAQFKVLERGTGMPVVLLHGFPLDHSMWDNQVEPIAAHDRVIVPDLRGFGGSDVTPGVVTMEQMAEDVAGILDALEIDEPIVLCGLSMGGYVAFEFWRKYPKRVRGIVLCDTRAMPDTAEAAKYRHETAEKVLAEGTAPLADAMLPKLFAPATLELHSSMTAMQRDRILATSPDGAAAALRGMAVRDDSRPILAKISLPALVIVGEQDAISTVDEMQSISSAMPNAQLVVIPHAGHMTPLENAPAFQEALDPFLKSLRSMAKA